MRQTTINGVLVTRPTRDDIESLQVGDLAPDCFGKMSPVTSIIYRGVNVKGKAFVGFYTAFGENNSSISGSMTEDETVSTIQITQAFKQACLAPVV